MKKVKDKKKYPDQVVYDEEEGFNASLLPYATNIGAPAIVADDVSSWKQKGVNKVNHHLKSKFEELKAEYQRMVDEYNWNELVYSSKFSFEPIIGEEYHLYVGNDGNVFLSLIGPAEWKRECIGTFKINSEHRWIKID